VISQPTCQILSVLSFIVLMDLFLITIHDFKTRLKILATNITNKILIFNMGYHNSAVKILLVK